MTGSDVLIRPAVLKDVTGIARVHVDVWRSTYAGIVPDQYLEKLCYENREAMWRSIMEQNQQGSHLLVAVRGSGVIGFSSAGKYRGDGLNHDLIGELYAIYLRAENHGKGLGRQLFRQSFQILKGAGFKEIRLWALEDNPTCRFYRRMRGVETEHKMESFGDKKLKEILFTWAETEVDAVLNGEHLS